METGFWTEMTYGQPTPIDQRKFSYNRNPVEFEPYEPFMTRIVGIDCEMVGTGIKGNQHVLGRVCIVNEIGKVILNKFVWPEEMVTNYFTAISGIRASDLQNAQSFAEVQLEVAAILHGRIVVGHDMVNDFRALQLDKTLYEIRDTVNYRPAVWAVGDISVQKCKLKKLAEVLLGYKIQVGEHCPAEDAQAAMRIYKKFQIAWEEDYLRASMHRRCNEPPSNLPEFRLTQYLAMYCTSTKNPTSLYVSLVSQNGELVYHSLVDQYKASKKWSLLERMCKDRILVGHNLTSTISQTNELPENIRKCTIHDIAVLGKLLGAEQESTLTVLAKKLLNLRIEEGPEQEGGFNALAIMQLFMKYRTEWPPDVTRRNDQVMVASSSK